MQLYSRFLINPNISLCKQLLLLLEVVVVLVVVLFIYLFLLCLSRLSERNRV